MSGAVVSGDVEAAMKFLEQMQTFVDEAPYLPVKMLNVDETVLYYD
jgi:hypothetical protein